MDIFFKSDEREVPRANPFAESAGHRLEAGARRIAAFARELPRGKPRPGAGLRYRVGKRAVLCGGEAGWYRGSVVFRPSDTGRETFFVPANAKNDPERMEKYV